MRIIDIAKVCHQANKALCETEHDFSQVDWQNADKEIMLSAVDGVENALEDGYTPQMSHESWCKFKLSHGWVHGVVKSAEHKTHPCLVEYDKLPKHQKAKDSLFISIVNSLKHLLGKHDD